MSLISKTVVALSGFGMILAATTAAHAQSAQLREDADAAGNTARVDHGSVKAHKTQRLQANAQVAAKSAARKAEPRDLVLELMEREGIVPAQPASIKAKIKTKQLLSEETLVELQNSGDFDRQAIVRPAKKAVAPLRKAGAAPS